MRTGRTLACRGARRTWIGSCPGCARARSWSLLAVGTAEHITLDQGLSAYLSTMEMSRDDRM